MIWHHAHLIYIDSRWNQCLYLAHIGGWPIIITLFIRITRYIHLIRIFITFSPSYGIPFIRRLLRLTRAMLQIDELVMESFFVLLDFEESCFLVAVEFWGGVFDEVYLRVDEGLYIFKEILVSGASFRIWNWKIEAVINCSWELQFTKRKMPRSSAQWR